VTRLHEEPETTSAAPTQLHGLRRLGAVPAATVEFRELRYFTVLCEELHFGRAAERLHISQSPLSQSIAQLERKLGTRLLERSSRHVQLTPAGEVLREHAERLLRELNDAVGATRRAGGGELGPLRVATGPVARVAVLPGLRHVLDERMPQLVVDVADMAGDDVVEAVLYGSADAGLMLCVPDRDDVESALVRVDIAVAVLRPEHPLAERDSVTIAELAQHTLVLAPRTVSKGAHDLVVAMFQGNPPAATRVIEGQSGASWDAMHADGFAVMPASAAVSGDFVTVPISDAGIEFPISLVWSKATPPAVLGHLLDAADAAADLNSWR
jgi:DNA-binding transcriptional LysR family regulator